MAYLFREYFLLYALASICLGFTPIQARAGNITLQGLFTRDDDVQLFDMDVTAPGVVDIRTYGYAGGITSKGNAVPRGGFDPILTLFNSAGSFLAENDEGLGVAIDPTTGQAYDARITLKLATGNYVVALTQFDNFSAGNLADGFVETGNPHFTADPTFAAGGPCPGNLFRDVSRSTGRCRNGSWAVDFVNVASVTERPASVPEPGTTLLLGFGLVSVGAILRRRLIRNIDEG